MEEEKKAILERFEHTVAKDVFFICVLNGEIGVPPHDKKPSGIATLKESEIWWDEQTKGARVWKLFKVRGKDRSVVSTTCILIRSK